jgi:hypothetical protein
MTERKILITGPLTDDELGEIIQVVQRIEERRPRETFSVSIDSPDTLAAAQEFFERINPRRPGYSRVTITRHDPEARC